MDKKKVVLVWFRNDLRLHDNEILLEAVQKADIIKSPPVSSSSRNKI
ncbi:deoxyribodipyrimidine photo-lyase [Sphingobacterium populi]